jgi:hypothetical protein
MQYFATGKEENKAFLYRVVEDLQSLGTKTEHTLKLFRNPEPVLFNALGGYLKILFKSAAS